MKKLTTLLLICLLLMASVLPVCADNCASYLYVEGNEFSAAQTFQLVFAADCDKVSGLSAEITTLDNLTIISGKGLLEGWDFSIAGNKIVMYEISGESAASGENEFFELTVKVNSNCAEGDEVNLELNASLATVAVGYKTVNTAASFNTVLQECQHFDTAWLVVTPPSGGNLGVKAEYCISCGEVLRQEQIGFLLGDSDLNGLVNVADAVLVARYTSNISQMTAEQLQCGDVDGSGFVNIADAVIISKYAARLINKFPAEL